MYSKNLMKTTSVCGVKLDYLFLIIRAYHVLWRKLHRAKFTFHFQWKPAKSKQIYFVCCWHFYTLFHNLIYSLAYEMNLALCGWKLLEMYAEYCFKQQLILRYRAVFWCHIQIKHKICIVIINIIIGIIITIFIDIINTIIITIRRN